MLFFLFFIPEDINLQKKFEIQNMPAENNAVIL